MSTSGFFLKNFILGHSFTFYVITVIYIKLAVFNQIDKYFLSEMGLKIRGYNVQGFFLLFTMGLCSIIKDILR